MFWIGTRGGLDRLDLKQGTFTHYRNSPATTQSLSSNDISSLYRDRRGYLWVGTLDHGIDRFDPDTQEFENYRFDPLDPGSLSADHVTTICKDGSGVLWVGTATGGLNRFDRQSRSFVRYAHDPNDPKSLSSDLVTSIFRDRTGMLWVGTRGGGVNKIIARDFRHFRTTAEGAHGIAASSVRAIYEDSSGAVWAGTSGAGIVVFDQAGNPRRRYRHNPESRTSLSHDQIKSIHEDRTGIIWIGTRGGGLDAFHPRSGIFEHHRHDPGDSESLGHDDVSQIYEDSRGKLWIGTWGGGLDLLDRQTGVFTHFKSTDLSHPGDLRNNMVVHIYEDRAGALWIGTRGGLFEMSWGDPSEPTFTHYGNEPGNRDSLSDDYVTSIHEDEAGIFWIGTYGAGLNRFDRDEGTFNHYTENDGLANNVVYGILGDESGNLWMSTNKGLSRFDPRSATFENFDTSDGLQGNEYNRGAFYKNRGGELFFEGLEGFNSFFPSEISRNAQAPIVTITSFSRSGEVVAEHLWAADEISLRYQDRHVTFRYATLDYKTPEKNGHAHQLVGFDEAWVDSSPRGVATYTNLSPGNYSFWVKGSNSDGVWKVGSSVTFVVEPPFWGTWWFRFLSLSAVFGLVLAGHRIRTLSILKSRERLRAANARLESEIAQRKDTEEKLEHTIRELESRSAEIEAKNAEMERFVYTASHDLKTPLVTITGFLGMVKKGAISGDIDAVSRDIERIRTAAGKMGRLLNELVDLARVGHVEIVAAEVSLVELAHEVREMTAGAFDERGVEVIISARLPVVVGDRRRLREALVNLLDNAVKFMGDQNQPVVEIGVRKEPEGPVFFVRDNGEGIKPDFHAKIFELFEQLDQSVDGTGIGLAVVKRSIGVHGGRVWVESEGPGHGCTFCFTLPQA